ncbi:MAG TPA: EAL domain-containing protein [Micromonosporaceae bacterium]|nr:EAL domain-containing protein [Micromonosporaceae bacterium]
MAVPPSRLAGLRVVASRARRTDPLLLTSFSIVIFAIVWFGVNLDRPRALWLLWLPSPLAAAMLTAVFQRVARTERLPALTRRFWRHLSFSAAMVGAGSLAQAYDALQDPLAGGQRTGPAMLISYTCAIAIVMWALLRLPLGVQARGERLRVALDAGTVMLAAAAFLWHFNTRPLLALGADRSTTLITSAMVALLALLAVFAIAKVVLSSHAFIDRAALRLLACAILIGSLSALPQQYLSSQPHLMSTQLSVPAVMFLAAWAGVRQRASGQLPAGTFADVGRRPFTVLPYLAVAAVDALLLTLLWSPNDDELVIGVVAVLLTGLVVLRQVTAFQDNRRLLDQLDHGATHDTLTNLPNRRLFNERLQHALTSGTPRTVSVALIDLDDFKVVNDNLGHEIGDALLVAVAQRLTTCVRAPHTVARLGGDEFVLILDEVGPAAASATAETITAALTEPIAAQGHELLIRASIGIADGGTGDEPSQLLRRADIAMYAAKNLGGSRHLHYQAGMAGTVANHAQLGVELRQAILAEQFVALYQPIVSLDSDAQITGVEALVRWVHPVRGMLPPSEFIPLAERTGLIVPLGRWILRHACFQLVAWTAEHGATNPAFLNVNVSARELREGGYADDVAAALADSGLAPDRLTLEITETTIFELGASVTNLQHLRDMGVRIALDDFGTGQSTLTQLQNCPVDQLKLDRSFTRATVNTEPTIAAAVLQLARVLRLAIIAEGVETAQEAHRLRHIGYETAQGYFFARPMPAEELNDRLRAQAHTPCLSGAGGRIATLPVTAH